MRMLGVFTLSAVLGVSGCGESGSKPGGPGGADRAQALRKAVRENPTSGRAHLDLARAYFEMGEDAAGKAVLFRAMALAPEDAEITKLVGEVTPRIAQIPMEEAYAARDRLEAADTVAAVTPTPAPPSPEPVPEPGPEPDPVPSPPPEPEPTPTPRAGGGPAVGHYKCYAHMTGATNYIFVDLDIEGPDTYRDKQGTRASYRFDPATRAIVFEGGSLAPYNARLLGPRKIGIAEKPRTSMNTICDLQ